ncbi:hypothetical protein K2X30_03860 [bacterium]|jgi:hypothetical protein|nr:hypothetical protein [bacterium]
MKYLITAVLVLSSWNASAEDGASPYQIVFRTGLQDKEATFEKNMPVLEKLVKDFGDRFSYRITEYPSSVKVAKQKGISLREYLTSNSVHCRVDYKTCLASFYNLNRGAREAASGLDMEGTYSIPLYYYQIEAEVQVGNCWRTKTAPIPKTENKEITTTVNQDLFDYMQELLGALEPKPFFGWSGVESASVGTAKTIFKYEKEPTPQKARDWKDHCRP